MKPTTPDRAGTVVRDVARGGLKGTVSNRTTVRDVARVGSEARICDSAGCVVRDAAGV